MTGSAPVLDRPALRAALSHMQIELPGGASRFEAVLAEEQGWPLDFAERVTDEYCGFLYLAATAGFEVTPSRAVDEAWHLHLRYPHYREVLCRKILGRPLEHRPATDAPDDEERCRRQYQETLALYEDVFGKPPPADIWPRLDMDGDEEDDLEAARERSEKLSRRIALGSLVGSGVALAAGVPAIGIVLAGAALLFFLLGQPSPQAAARDPRSSGCGGGGCGGGGGSSGDDCGSGCGAGSCGGGCGGD